MNPHRPTRAGVIRALTRNRARTAPDHPDRRLRGREYPLSPRPVWEAVRAAVAGMPRWRVVSAAEPDGELLAEARTRLWRFVDDVRVQVRAAGAGCTRVDVASAARVGRADLGANARRIARFLQTLDRHVRDLAPARGGVEGSIRDADT
jgi:uncharacterized protein (DUF1499 family)